MTVFGSKVFIEILFEFGIGIKRILAPVRNVFAPVIHIQGYRITAYGKDIVDIGVDFPAAGKKAKAECQRQKQSNDPVIHFATAFFFLRLGPIKLIIIKSASITIMIIVHNAYILNLTSCAV